MCQSSESSVMYCKLVTFTPSFQFARGKLRQRISSLSEFQAKAKKKVSHNTLAYSYL